MNVVWPVTGKLCLSCESKSSCGCACCIANSARAYPPCVRERSKGHRAHLSRDPVLHPASARWPPDGRKRTRRARVLWHTGRCGRKGSTPRPGRSAAVADPSELAGGSCTLGLPCRWCRVVAASSTTLRVRVGILPTRPVGTNRRRVFEAAVVPSAGALMRPRVGASCAIGLESARGPLRGRVLPLGVGVLGARAEAVRAGAPSHVGPQRRAGSRHV